MDSQGIRAKQREVSEGSIYVDKEKYSETSAPQGENVGCHSTSSPNDYNGRRILPRLTRQLRAKWKSMDEQPGRSRQPSSRAAQTERRSLKESRQCFSVELGFQQYDAEPARPIEGRQDECARWKLRRGAICEELEKSCACRGHSLYQLRKAIIVKDTLYERFLF